eukprot:Amastigsp_a176706_112.p4 type:complete len:136 gc:universal Amastigsp_a176706_112:738-331(-)
MFLPRSVSVSASKLHVQPPRRGRTRRSMPSTAGTTSFRISRAPSMSRRLSASRVCELWARRLRRMCRRLRFARVARQTTPLSHTTSSRTRRCRLITSRLRRRSVQVSSSLWMLSKARAWPSAVSSTTLRRGRSTS